MNYPDYRDKFRQMSDRDWISRIVRSYDTPVIDGVRFPGFPEESVQVSMVGSSGEHSLVEASLFYREIKSAMEKAKRPFSDSTRILDFGCGYGRHYRFFLKDVPQENIIGTDLDADFIRICRETIAGGTFMVNRAYPPLDLPPASFDLIYAFSVFSHLNEEIGLAWVSEFARLLKPGGLLVVTSHSRSFIDYCASLRKEPQEGPWQRALAEKAFIDGAAAQRDYENGGFLYAPTGGGGPRTADIYGEAVLSPLYVERSWRPYLKMIDFYDDPRRLPQSVIIMQKS